MRRRYRIRESYHLKENYTSLAFWVKRNMKSRNLPWGEQGLLWPEMQRIGHLVSQGLISCLAKLTFILLIKCFNAIKFTVTQKRMLGVMSSKLMTFIHFFLTLREKKKKGRFGIIQRQYSRSFQSKHLHKDRWHIYWRECLHAFLHCFFPFLGGE